MSETNVNWSAVVGSDAEASSPVAVRAAAPSNLPPFPEGVSYLIGRLPIKSDTAVAIVQLPEALKGVSCAAVQANTGVLSDCYRDHSKACAPNVKRAFPKNDREIKVILDGASDETVTGAGWAAGTYPGSMPKTRSVEVGVPYVEVWVYVGLDCGCNGEDWAADNQWGQP